jgi:hypothetical protein
MEWNMDSIIDYTDINIIIKMSLIVLLGLIVISNINNSSSISKNNQVTLTFTKNPQDLDTIKLGNTIYEFTDTGNATQGNIPVIRGPTLSETVTNFRNVASSNYNVE